jgi:signal transduction histidine kinase
VSFSLPRFRGAPLDALLAVGLLVVGESQVLLGWHDGGVGAPPEDHRLALAVLCLVLVVPLAWRRRHPLPVLGVVAAAVVAQLLVAPYVPFLAGLVPLTIANYSVAAYARRWRPCGLLFALLAVAVIFARIPEERTAGEVLFTLFVVVGTWVAGDVVHARVARANASVTAAEATLAEQEHAYAEALEDERARIARELHDVIAHSVSVMGVQAGAARTLLDTDPEAARDALMAIELTARDSVTELQRLLTVLRGDGSSPERSPQPGLGQLPSLVERMREAGLPIQVSAEIDHGVVPTGVDLAAYRIVQEALTNALKHAGTSTVVQVRRHDGAVEIEVRNAAAPSRPASSGGHGIVGMRERAQLYDGTLSAGPDELGGFVVHASLPLGPERVPAPASL